MPVTPEELDPDRQQKAREYARLRHRLLLLDLAIATAGVLIVLFSGLGTWLRNVLHPLGWQPIAAGSPGGRGSAFTGRVFGSGSRGAIPGGGLGVSPKPSLLRRRRRRAEKPTCANPTTYPE